MNRGMATKARTPMVRFRFAVSWQMTAGGYGTRQTKLAASSMLPVPLYLAT